MRLTGRQSRGALLPAVCLIPDCSVSSLPCLPGHTAGPGQEPGCHPDAGARQDQGCLPMPGRLLPLTHITHRLDAAVFRSCRASPVPGLSLTFPPWVSVPPLPSSDRWPLQAGIGRRFSEPKLGTAPPRPQPTPVQIHPNAAAAPPKAAATPVHGRSQAGPDVGNSLLRSFMELDT